MKKTWDDIIESDVESIFLIGYGSILNSKTLEGKTQSHNAVIVHGFQRIYNLKMVPDGFCREKLKKFMEKYWGKYGITTMKEVEKLAEKNYCVLNCIKTENTEDRVNGVLIEILREDFETYKTREEIYDLFETPYCIINPKNGEIEKCHKQGYILSAHTQYLIEDGSAFIPYHNLARSGAYNFGEYFGKLFDETTHRVQK